jgi:hypothetical protein
MIKKIKKIFTEILFQQEYFSQDGEDYIAKKILKNIKNGVYLDVGSAHPILYNNTFHFYNNGWNGICIDGNSDYIKPYAQFRKKDIFVNCLVGEQQKIKNYFVFNEPLLNTTLKSRVKKLESTTNYKHKDTKKILQLPINQICKKNKIDTNLVNLISLDIEGSELEALHSINWKECSPELIIVEILAENRETIFNSRITKFLKQKKYSIKIVLQRSVIFCSKKITFKK